MIQSLPYQFLFDEIVELKGILNTEDDFDIGYSVEVDIIYPDATKKIRTFSILSRD